jgi:creatinine amidohydrolase
LDKNLQRLTGHKYKSAGFRIGILPLGSTEYHGDHLPYGSDTFVAKHLAESLAERVEDVIVLPVLPYGMSRHYQTFPLNLSLSSETLVRVLRDLFSSLLEQGMEILIIINGHDGNIASIETASREFRVDHPEMKIAVLEAWWETAGKLLPEKTFEVWGGLGHAGEGETSVNLAINPELVDMERAKGVVPELPEHIEIKWLFEELTPYGVTGDPTKATAKKGEMMLEALLDILEQFVMDMDLRNWEL